MSLAATTPAGAATLGRTRITATALKRIVSAVAAESLGVDAGHVGVDIVDSDGSLALTVTTPIRVVSLDRVQEENGVVARSGGSIVDRAARAQETIRSRVNTLSGSAIGRVTVRISGITVQSGARVT